MEMVTVPLYLLYWVPIEYVKSLFCLDGACALPTRPDASSPVSGDRVELPTQHFIAHFLSLRSFPSFFLFVPLSPLPIGQQLFWRQFSFWRFGFFNIFSLPCPIHSSIHSIHSIFIQTHRDWVFNN